VSRLIKPVPIRAIRQFQIEIPEQMRDDEAHLVVRETNACVNTCRRHFTFMMDVAWVGCDLLHPEAVSRASRERLEDFLLVARETWIEALGVCGEPAFGNEAVAVGEVIRRAVGGEVRDADADLWDFVNSLLGER
jgi:hypothetical protein